MFAGMIYRHRMAIGGEKGPVQQRLSNPIWCWSCSRRWGKEYSGLHLVPRLFPGDLVLLQLLAAPIGLRSSQS